MVFFFVLHFVFKVKLVCFLVRNERQIEVKEVQNEVGVTRAGGKKRGRTLIGLTRTDTMEISVRRTVSQDS